MTSHHFFVDPTDIDGEELTLRGDEAHHAGRVLRVNIGESITAADGTGRVVTCVVTSVGDTVDAEITGDERREQPRPAITLFQAVTKGDKLELVIEKATEVGVQKVAPYIADRTIVRWDDHKLERVRERLQAIAKAAAKQSKAAFLPEVCAIAPTLRDAAGMRMALVLHEAADVRLRDVLPDEAPDELTLVVGPEGGLSEAEIGTVMAAGATLASLGPQILRTETAGPVAAAVVGFRYGWFG